MNINILRVLNGDAIHISYNYNEKEINILIDSGPESAYVKEKKETRAPRRVIGIEGEFKKFMDNMKEKKRTIDLLIITHVDYDHIGGILNGWNQMNLIVN